MSVTLVGEPQDLTPGYNPLIWFFNSTNKNLPGFRYYVQVYNGATLIGTFRYAPAITTGYAPVDISEELRNFLSYDDFTSGIHLVPNSWMNPTIKVYEEYATSYIYDDFIYAAGDLTNLHSYAGVTHSFSPGDLVSVSQTDGGTMKPMLQGVFSVITPTIAGSSSLYIDIPFSVVGSGATMGGTVIYADNRKTISGLQYTTGTHSIFNGAIPWVSFPEWDKGDYKMTASSSTTKFLTSMPRTGFKVYDTSNVRLNLANYYTNVALRFENDGGNIFGLTTSITTASYPIIGASVGPTTTTSLISGTGSFITATTSYYDVYVVSNIQGIVTGWGGLYGGTGYVSSAGLSTSGGSGTGLVVGVTQVAGVVNWVIINNGGTGYIAGDVITITGGGNGDATFSVVDIITNNYQVSEKIRFEIDRRCRIEEVDILFLDKMGSLNTFSFELRNKQTISNERSTFKKLAGALGTDLYGPAFTYTSLVSGEITYNVTQNTTYELNTNWMDDAASLYLQELITSPIAAIKLNGTLQTCIPSITNSEVKRQKDKRLIRYTISVRLAGNDRVNI